MRSRGCGGASSAVVSVGQQRHARRAAATVFLALACVPLLSGCGDRPWKGEREERIDAAVASIDFSSVGGIDCDYRRPGNNIAGSAAMRLIGIAGADNGQAVVDLLVAAGYGTNGRTDDLSDGYISLSDNAGVVEFAISVVTEGDRRYAFGHCTSPPDGAVDVRVLG